MLPQHKHTAPATEDVATGGRQNPTRRARGCHSHGCGRRGQGCLSMSSPDARWTSPQASGERGHVEKHPRCWVWVLCSRREPVPEGGLPLLGRAGGSCAEALEARPTPTSLPGHAATVLPVLTDAPKAATCSLTPPPCSPALLPFPHIRFSIYYPTFFICLQCILVFILCSNGPRFGHGKAHQVGAVFYFVVLILTHGYFSSDF